MKPLVWLFLVAALCGCGQERAVARPPDVKLPLLDPQPGSTVPLGTWVELVFEEHESDVQTIPSTTMGIPGRILTQVVVRCRLGEEFDLRVSGVTRHYSVTGTPEAFAAKEPLDDSISLRLTCENIHARGPVQDRMEVRTRLCLAPQSRMSFAMTSEDTSLHVWFRPYVAPAPKSAGQPFQTR